MILCVNKRQEDPESTRARMRIGFWVWGLITSTMTVGKKDLDCLGLTLQEKVPMLTLEDVTAADAVDEVLGAVEPEN